MQLAANPIFWSVVSSIVIAGAIKFLTDVCVEHRKWSLISFVETGGMPSQHTAVITALTLSIYLQESFSPLFFLSFVLAGIVIRDALGVRRTAGEEGQALNQLLKKNKLTPLRHVANGHTPIQVAMGIGLGLICAIVSFSLLA